MLSRAAAVQPGTLDEEARTVDLVFTTGARVLRAPWYGKPYQEELSLEPKHVRLGRLNGGAPLLDSHNGWGLSGVMGVVVAGSARLEKGQGVATVRFAKAEDDPEADKVFRKVKDGIIRNVSVGYRVHKMTKVEEGEGQIPVMRAEDWEPMEISLVPMGADAAAGVRAEGAETNPCVFVEDEPLEDKRMSKIKDDPQGGTPTPTPAPAPAVDAEAIRKEAAESAAQAERARAAEIRRVATGLGLPEEFAARHISEGTDIAAFKSAAIDERAEKQTLQTGPAMRVEAGEDARDKRMRGQTAWLLVRSGTAASVRKAAEARGEKIDLDPGEFRGRSLLEMARMALENAGVRTAGMSKLDIVGKALTMRDGSGSGIGDFPILLENAMHKTLLAEYAITPDTWSRFCKIGSVGDFRDHPRYRTSSFGVMPTVLEGGEYTTTSLGDAEKEVVAAGKKGMIFGLTREAIVNDDMDAFSRVPGGLGRAARRTVEAAVYAELALNSNAGPAMSDGDELFHANHGNITTSAAISVAALDLDRQAFRSQMDPSGNDYLELQPAILLCGLAVGGQARVINDAQYDPDTSGKLQRPNMVRGLFREIIDTPRISGNRRYLFADPNDAPTIEVAFHDGQQEPTIEVKDGWRVDGVEWKVGLIFGVAAVDWRAAVMNAGG